MMNGRTTIVSIAIALLLLVHIIALSRAGDIDQGTAMPISTISPTLSITPTLTLTQTLYPTFTTTPTPTFTISPSPSYTPSLTSMYHITVSPQVTRTFTPQKTLTFTHTPEITQTLTFTPTHSAEPPGFSVYLPVIIKDFQGMPTLIFEDYFQNGLGNWSIFGSPAPYIDITFGNPPPSLELNGDANLSNGALSFQGFLPDPGMSIRFNLQMDYGDSGPNWVGFGFSREWTASESYQNSLLLAYMGSDSGKIYLADCGVVADADQNFHEFKFIVRSDYRLDAFFENMNIPYCVSTFTVDEFVNKPLIVHGREGRIDNIIITNP